MREGAGWFGARDDSGAVAPCQKKISSFRSSGGERALSLRADEPNLLCPARIGSLDAIDPTAVPRPLGFGRGRAVEPRGPERRPAHAAHARRARRRLRDPDPPPPGARAAPRDALPRIGV